MADLDAQEMTMFARWHGTTDLVHNEAFWKDCLETYKDKTVTLPYDDTPEQREHISQVLRCPPGACGECCRYDRVAVTPEELKLISANVRQRVNTENDAAGNLCLKSAGGCQFLKDNVCTIYSYRPAVCRGFPILAPRQTVSPDGKVFNQLQMRLKCPPALEAIKEYLSRACSGGKLMILPDLSIIPTCENTAEMLNTGKQEA
jgi:Fe-S-cluster containining protein